MKKDEFEVKEAMDRLLVECETGEGFLCFAAVLNADGKLHFQYVKHQFKSADIPIVVKSFRKHAYRDLENIT